MLRGLEVKGFGFGIWIWGLASIKPPYSGQPPGKDELAVYCVADFEALAIADGFVFESVALGKQGLGLR